MDRTKEATAEMKEKLDAMKAELAPALELIKEYQAAGEDIKPKAYEIETRMAVVQELAESITAKIEILQQEMEARDQ